MPKTLEPVQSVPAEAEHPSQAHGGDPALRSLAIAVSHHLKGEREEALLALESAPENGSSLAEVLAARSNIQFEMERYTEAAENYARLRELQPDRAEVSLSLGLCLQKLGRYSEAIDSFRQALALSGKHLETQLAIGECLLRMNKH